MAMTEKTPELKTAPFDRVGDSTVVDTPRLDREEDHETPPSDPDPLAFNPDKFSRIEISYEMQQKMAQTKLPRLGQEYFLDTVPPNQGLQAPAPPAEGERIPASGANAAEVIAKPRPAVGVVIVCLLGAVLLVVLAIARSWNREPEPKAVMPSPSETPTASTPVVASPPPEVVVPPPPAVSAGPAEHAVQSRPTKGTTTGHRIPAHPSQDPLPVSKPTPPAQPDVAAAPTASVAPTPTSPPHAAPVQSAWFDYK
jgi:hypothetical protein